MYWGTGVPKSKQVWGPGKVWTGKKQEKGGGVAIPPAHKARQLMHSGAGATDIVGTWLQACTSKGANRDGWIVTGVKCPMHDQGRAEMYWRPHQ